MVCGSVNATLFLNSRYYLINFYKYVYYYVYVHVYDIVM